MRNHGEAEAHRRGLSALSPREHFVVLMRLFVAALVLLGLSALHRVGSVATGLAGPLSVLALLLLLAVFAGTLIRS
jgi:hypothetical protein